MTFDFRGQTHARTHAHTLAGEEIMACYKFCCDKRSWKRPLWELTEGGVWTLKVAAVLFLIPSVQTSNSDDNNEINNNNYHYQYRY